MSQMFLSLTGARFRLSGNTDTDKTDLDIFSLKEKRIKGEVVLCMSNVCVCEIQVTLSRLIWSGYVWSFVFKIIKLKFHLFEAGFKRN